jgi:hypothetical protein
MARTKPHQGGDLFQIFPDLPWCQRRCATAQVEKARSQGRLTQMRANEHIRRLREATERMRAAFGTQMPRRRRR